MRFHITALIAHAVIWGAMRSTKHPHRNDQPLDADIVYILLDTLQQFRLLVIGHLLYKEDAAHGVEDEVKVQQQLVVGALPRIRHGEPVRWLLVG